MYAKIASQSASQPTNESETTYYIYKSTSSNQKSGAISKAVNQPSDEPITNTIILPSDRSVNQMHNQQTNQLARQPDARQPDSQAKPKPTNKQPINQPTSQSNQPSTPAKKQPYTHTLIRNRTNMQARKGATTQTNLQSNNKHETKAQVRTQV